MKPYFVLMVLITAGFIGVRYVFTDRVKQYFGARAYLSLAVILGCGYAVHSVPLFLLVVAGVLILTVTSPLDALCRLVMLSALCPGINPKVIIGSLYLTAVPIVFVLTAAALVAALARQVKTAGTRVTAEDLLILLLVACFGIAAARAQSFTGIQRALFTAVLGLGFPYFVYRRLLNNRAALELGIAAWAGSAMILAVLALCEARLHWPLYDWIYANLSDDGLVYRNTKMRGGIMRAPTSFYDSTAFSVFQLTGMFAVIAARPFFRNSLLWFGGIGLTLLGLLAAQSRAATLGVLVGLFFLMLVRRRYTLAAAIGGGGVMIVALLLAMASAGPNLAASSGAGTPSAGDQDYRQTLLRRGLQVGMEHPILGDDMMRVVDKMSDIKQGEGIVDFVNTYLTIFLASGAAGLLCFTILITAVIIKMLRSPPIGRDRSPPIILTFVAGAMAAELFTLAFTSFLYDRNAYWLLMLLAFCRAMVMHRSSAAEAAPALPVSSHPALRPSAVHRWPADPVPDLA